MVEVTDKMKEILIDQIHRTTDGQVTIRRILEEIRKQVFTELVSVPQIDNTTTAFSAAHMRLTLNSINEHIATFEAEAQKELVKGITESWEAGYEMLPKMMSAAGISTGFGISRNLLNQFDPWLSSMKDFTSGMVEHLAVDAQLKIKGELSLGVLGQKTPYEVAQAVAANLPAKLPEFKSGKSIFKNISERAAVITETEMGRVFSMASHASMLAAAETLPNLKKMWLHAGHPKTPRPSHLALNGDIKPVKTPFLLGNIRMQYPRDPAGPISEIIRCGCMSVTYMPELGTKEEFLKSWEDAQAIANAPIKKKKP